MEGLVSGLINKTPMGGRNNSSSNLDGTFIGRSLSPTYNFNRSSINYSNQASKDKGDMIDVMHQILTEMEKRRRKVGEIIEIVRKYQPSPIQTPYTDVSNATIKDREKRGPQNIPSQDKPHSHEIPAQTHTYRIGITGQGTRTEKAPQDVPSGQKRETKRWSIRTEYLVNPDGDNWDANPQPNVKWVTKLDMFGNIIDAYRVFKDPIEELRYIAKQNEKSSGILYQ